MEAYLFKQLEFARNQTLKALDGVEESTAIRIPEPFRNHLLWQAGHIYTVQERFAFGLHGFDAQIPESFKTLFAPGTTPVNWAETPPALTEVIDRLREQPSRIQAALKGRLDEQAPSSYTTGSGLTLSTIGEFLNFTFYHEGMHFHSIKHYIAILDQK